MKVTVRDLMLAMRALCDRGYGRTEIVVDGYEDPLMAIKLCDEILNITTHIETPNDIH